MQGPDRFFDLVLRDDAGDAYLRGSNQQDVDVLLKKRLEHLGRIARGILHPGPDD